MLVVMALGGNALLRRNQPLEAEVQRRNVIAAVANAVAPLARKHRVVVTHGNGPQIGLRYRPPRTRRSRPILSMCLVPRARA
jgi:carbamate kinase